MKRDPAQLVGEYLTLVEKGDQTALIDFVARHPDELGSLSLLTARPARQELSTDRRKTILQAVALFAMVLFALVFVSVDLLRTRLDLGVSPLHSDPGRWGGGDSRCRHAWRRDMAASQDWSVDQGGRLSSAPDPTL